MLKCGGVNRYYPPPPPQLREKEREKWREKERDEGRERQEEGGYPARNHRDI